MGLVADLTAGEIVEQAVHALKYSNFRNVVFMGMVSRAFLAPPSYDTPLCNLRAQHSQCLLEAYLFVWTCKAY